MSNLYDNGKKVYMILSIVSIGIIFSMYASFDQKKALTESLLSSLAVNLLSSAILFYFLEKSGEKIEKYKKEEIFIVVSSGAKEIKVPGYIRRDAFGRQEVLGRIGMLPMKEKGRRFSINYTNSITFIDDINKKAESQGSQTIYIHCTEEEMDQFSIDSTNKMDLEKISIVIKSKLKEIKIPGYINKDEFSRQEVIERIKIFQMKEKGKEFTIDYINDSKFIEDINRIHESTGDQVLFIICTDNEINQFN